MPPSRTSLRYRDHKAPPLGVRGGSGSGPRISSGEEDWQVQREGGGNSVCVSGSGGACAVSLRTGPVEVLSASKEPARHALGHGAGYLVIATGPSRGAQSRHGSMR